MKTRRRRPSPGRLSVTLGPRRDVFGNMPTAVVRCGCCGWTSTAMRATALLAVRAGHYYATCHARTCHAHEWQMGERRFSECPTCRSPYPCPTVRALSPLYPEEVPTDGPR